MERLTEWFFDHWGTRTERIDGKIVGTQTCLNKLAEYENAEEKGLLLKLPCVYKATVYVIPTEENGFKEIAEMECLGYSIGQPSNNANLFSKNRFDKNVPKMYQPSIDDFGKTWFLNRDEAEQAYNNTN